jgi:hypothetical protein
MRVTLGHKGRYAHSTPETGELERDELLMSLLGGIPIAEPAPIARFDIELARKVGSQTDIVKIDPVVINKMRAKHTMSLEYDLGLLHHGCLMGRVQQDGPRSLIVLFPDPRKPRRTLMLVLKASRDGVDLLVSTYHVCTGKKLKAALKRGMVLRDDGSWDTKE